MDKLRPRKADFIEARLFDTEPRALSVVEKSDLFAVCRNVATDSRRQPWHVVHPTAGELLVYNVRGEAVWPDCGARWRHVGNIIRLAEEGR